MRGKKLPGAAQSFRKIPNGVPGVETRLPLLFSEGVNKGRITLQQFVALSSANAAKAGFRYPQASRSGRRKSSAVWTLARA